MVTEKDLARIFRQTADVLEIKGEPSRRSLTYRRAAQSIESYGVSLSNLIDEGKLKDIPGIGEFLSAQVMDIYTTGESQYLKSLVQELPEGLLELLDIPGVGPKTVRKLKEAGITDIVQLEKAANLGLLSEIDGFGVKKEQSILEGINMIRELKNVVLLAEAKQWADIILMWLRNRPEVDKGSYAGSLRRGKEIVKDVDLVVSSRDMDLTVDELLKAPFVDRLISSGSTFVSFYLRGGPKADIRICKPEEYVSFLHHFTGSKEHHVALRRLAKEKGYRLNEYGFSGKRDLHPESERELYGVLDLAYIPPELREGQGEINVEIPELINIKDIQGDLHVHSRYSDGIEEIENLVKATKARGYSYFAITDHSRSLVVANGLDEERLREQIGRIKEIYETAEIEILTGIEVEILKDGSLDFSDSFLGELDLVVASIHSGLRQDRAQITERLLRAIANPHVDIIGHPTGRVLAYRRGYEADWDTVFRAAREYGTILEINASPNRLDLGREMILKAKEYGVLFAVSSDAHSIAELEYMLYGVLTARRGWLTKEQVVNTWTKERLKQYLKDKRREQ